MHNQDLRINLDAYQNSEFKRGRSRIVELCWRITSALYIETFLPGNFARIFLLRLFGAKIGTGVVIKPGVKVKFPWRLSVGDHCWLGEGAWFDSLQTIEIGDNCCISQAAYLCTGSHDWNDPHFGLVTRGIRLEHGVWIGAHAVIAPGACIESGGVITAGSVFSGKSVAWSIYQGNPAIYIKPRQLKSTNL